jgi:hypothetical protein
LLPAAGEYNPEVVNVNNNKENEKGEVKKWHTPSLMKKS